MSLWAEDPRLFLHKGKDGVVHMLRCKKETMTLSSMSMLMKPEDLIDEGTITDHRSLIGGCYGWDKDKYEALIDYIYPKHLMVNCHGSVIGELAKDEKSLLFFGNYEKFVLAVWFTLIFLLMQLQFNLFHGNSAVLFTIIFLFVQLLFNRFYRNKKATIVLYIRALDILDMGSYGLGTDHSDRVVPARMVKYLQNGMVAQTQPAPREMKLSKEVETFQQELLSSKEKTKVEVAKGMKLTEELAIKSKQVETSEQELLLAKKKTEVELAKAKKLAEVLVIKSKEVETLQQELLSAKEKMEVEVAKGMKLTEELAIKSKQVETSEQELLLAKKKIGVELAKAMKLGEELAIKNAEVETLQQELLSSKKKTEVEVAKGMKLIEELAIKSKQVETSEQMLLLANEKTGVELAKAMKLAEELAIKSEEVETFKRERLLKEKTVRIYTKAATHCSLTIRNGQAIFGYKDDSDDCQYWVKDDKYAAILKDKWGYPSYALVNQFTGQALKPGSNTKPVELVCYDPNVLDESVLWLDVDIGDGYKAIRKATDPSLHLDSNLEDGKVDEGTIVQLWTWWNGNSQKWKLVPHT